MPGPINVAIVSLGCAKNLVDSESVSALLIEENFHLVTDLAEADVIIVNTCGFIDSAKEESIVKLLEMAAYKQKKSRVLLAAGCLAQRYGKELLEQMPEIDGIFGTNDLSVAALAIRRALAGKRPVYLQGKYSLPDDAPRLLSTPGHTAYLKIAEGCSNRCTYCAIPAIRGPYRSRSVSALVAEASSLAEKGVKELNLIAQDITLYGSDLGEEGGLPLLLEKLAGISGIKWLRLLYAYPERVDTGIIEIMADNDKICHYLDLPMQHGSNPYSSKWAETTSDSLLSLLARLRSKVKDIVLRSSFIVGFPAKRTMILSNCFHSWRKPALTGRFSLLIPGRKALLPPACPIRCRSILKGKGWRLLFLCKAASRKESRRLLWAAVLKLLWTGCPLRIPAICSCALTCRHRKLMGISEYAITEQRQAQFYRLK